MAIAYVQFPPLDAAAFNPIILIVQTPKARYAQLEKDLAAATDEAERTKIRQELAALEPDKTQDTLDPIPILVNIGGNAANKRVVIERDPDSEGKAEIDLSYIARHAFMNARLTPYAYTEYDYNLSARFTILSSDESEPVRTTEVINSVWQLGYYDSAGGLGGFERLTQTPMVRYEGYPFAVTFQQIPYSAYVATLHTGNERWDNYLPSPVGNVYVAGKGKDFDKLTILKGATIIADYAVKTGCVPDSPFYVRWINTRGGWDYHMFERREDTDEVSDISNIQRVATNQNDTQQTVSLSAVNTVTVGEGLLGRDEYLQISALPRSPRIEWYNEEIGAWQVIVLSEDFSATWNSRNSFGSVEFTFALPRILTQF